MPTTITEREIRGRPVKHWRTRHRITPGAEHHQIVTSRQATQGRTATARGDQHGRTVRQVAAEMHLPGRGRRRWSSKRPNASPSRAREIEKFDKRR
eukprot:6316497-Prymnesium_polylepis.2